MSRQQRCGKGRALHATQNCDPASFKISFSVIIIGTMNSILRFLRSALFVTVGTCLFAATSAAAQTVSEWRGIETAEVRLIQGAVDQHPGKIKIGLEFIMAPGWKVYWRSPGDAGFPPIANFAGSDNLAGFDIEWPVPKRFEYYGLQTFGYEERLVLPILINRKQAERDTRLKLSLSYAACADICVPVKAELALDLAAGPQAGNRHGRAIADSLSRVPPRTGTPVTHIAASRRSDSIQITAHSDQPFSNPEMILEGPESVSFGQPTCKSSTPGMREITCSFPFQGRGRPAPESTANYILTIAHANGWSAEQLFQIGSGN